jgi:hypothetical protein
VNTEIGLDMVAIPIIPVTEDVDIGRITDSRPVQAKLVRSHNSYQRGMQSRRMVVQAAWA